jgi:hypothetical protein
MKYLHIGVWFGICYPFTCRLDRDEGLGAECLQERFYRHLKNNILRNARLHRDVPSVVNMKIICETVTYCVWTDHRMLISINVELTTSFEMWGLLVGCTTIKDSKRNAGERS